LPLVSQPGIASALHGFVQGPDGQLFVDDEPDDAPDDDPDEVPDDVPDDALAHVPMVVSHVWVVCVQSVQAPPAVPHVVSPAVSQPLVSQQPEGQFDAQSAPLPEPEPVLLPEPEPVLLPLVSPLPLPASSPEPVLLPALEPVLTWMPPPSDASPGPSVAHATQRAATATETKVNGGRPRRKCILSVYLPALPPQAVHPATHAPRRARDPARRAGRDVAFFRVNAYETRIRPIASSRLLIDATYR
jgi:hypothetical protein